MKIYELYCGPKGPSCESKYYDKTSRQVWQVAAVSVKQAIFLAANGCWYGGRSNGIIAHKSGVGNEKWQIWDSDQLEHDSPYIHGRTFSHKK